MREQLLTEKEQSKLIEFRENIISRALSTERCDRDKAQQAYNRLLEHIGHRPVDNFIWVDSPYQMHGQLWDQLTGQLMDQLRGQLTGQLRDQLWGQLTGQLDDQLTGQLRDQLWDQLTGQLDDQLWGQLRGQLWDQIRNQLDQWYLQLIIWMDYVASLDGITADKENIETLRLLSDLGEHSFWILPTKNGAIFCDRPLHIHRDNSHALHHDYEPAIEFADGWSIYAIHGVRFDKETFEKIASKDFTVEDLANLDAEHRAAAISQLRADRMLEALNAEPISVGTKYARLGWDGRQETVLYKVEDFMGSGETEYCIKMKHPSLDQEYIEWVHPDVGVKADADLAQAQAFGWSKEQYFEALEA